MNFYGINSHSSFAIRLQYEELGLFIIIRPGCQKQLYCSPKTGCKITCLCAASIKMGLLLQLELRGFFILFMLGKWDHSLSFFFHPNKVTPTKALQAEQSGAGFAQNLRNLRNGGCWSSLAQDPSSSGIKVNTRPAQPQLHPAEPKKPPWTVIHPLVSPGFVPGLHSPH